MTDDAGSKPRPAGGASLGAWLATVIARWHLLVVLLAALVSALAYQGAARIKLDTSLEALMPKGVASVENLKKVLEKTGSFSSAMVVIDSPDPIAAERFAADLRTRLIQSVDWVEAAEYAEDFSVFEQHKLLYLDTDELRDIKSRLEAAAPVARAPLISEFRGAPVNVRIRSAPAKPSASSLDLDDLEQRLSEGLPGTGGTQKLFRSSDGRITLLVVWPKTGFSGLGPSKRIIRDLQDITADMAPASYHPEMRVDVGGRVYNKVVQFDAVLTDLGNSGLWSLGLIALLLTIYFRSLLAVPLIALPLVLGILWTLGLTGLVIGQLNLITVFLVLILFGLGVDFGIHNLSRYREERGNGADTTEALTAVYTRTGAASVIAAATTACGFLAMLATDFRAFYEFGLIAGTGIIFTFVAMYSVLPALIALAERSGFDLGTKHSASVSLFSSLATPALKRPSLALMVLGALSAGAVFYAGNVEFEGNFGRLQAERSPAHKAIQANISKVFPDGTDRAVLIVDSIEEVEAVRAYFDEYIANDTDTPTIRKIETVFSYLPPPDTQSERLTVLGDMRTILDDIDSEKVEDWYKYLNIDAMSMSDLPDGLERLFTGLPGSDGHLVYIFNDVSLNDAILARQFADDIRDIPVGEKTYHPAAEGIVFVDMLNLMKADAMLAISVVGGVTLLLTGLFFRRPKDVVIVLLPTAFAFIMLFGIMGAFDIRLSIFNMVVLPTLIGIGVDNGIHIVHRQREEGDVARAMTGTGGAAAITTLTTMLGFAGMLAASMGGLFSLGLVATIGLAACLVGTFTILPAALKLRAGQ